MAVCNYCYKTFSGQHECPSGRTFADEDKEHLMLLAPAQPLFEFTGDVGETESS